MYKCLLNSMLLLIPAGIAMVSIVSGATMKGFRMVVTECKFTMPSCIKSALHGKALVLPVMGRRHRPPD